MSGDTIALPGGKIITRARAFALGLVDADGNLKDDVPTDSAAAKVLAKDAKAAEWAAKQGLPAPKRRAPRAEADDADIDINEDGTPKPKRRKKVAVPQNVDAEGNPVTDEETLARIAAETAAIEAARKAAEAESDA